VSSGRPATQEIEAITSEVIEAARRSGNFLAMRTASCRTIKRKLEMSVTYIIGFNVRPEQRSRYLRLINGVLDAMRHEPMFVSATLHGDPADENRFLLHETWADHQDVLDVQLNRPYREEWHAALDELLAAPRDISMWQPMRSDYNQS
jgi:quinol monooxygenase YgiN